MKEFTFDLRFATLTDYKSQRVKVQASTVQEAFAQVAAIYANGSLRNIALVDIY